jgi:hypothetical protein
MINCISSVGGCFVGIYTPIDRKVVFYGLHLLVFACYYRLAIKLRRGEDNEEHLFEPLLQESMDSRSLCRLVIAMVLLLHFE